jgi:hypothetical protein
MFMFILPSVQHDAMEISKSLRGPSALIQKNEHNANVFFASKRKFHGAGNL